MSSLDALGPSDATSVRVKIRVHPSGEHYVRVPKTVRETRRDARRYFKKMREMMMIHRIRRRRRVGTSARVDTERARLFLLSSSRARPMTDDDDDDDDRERRRERRG